MISGFLQELKAYAFLVYLFDNGFCQRALAVVEQDDIIGLDPQHTAEVVIFLPANAIIIIELRMIDRGHGLPLTKDILEAIQEAVSGFHLTLAVKLPQLLVEFSFFSTDTGGGDHGHFHDLVCSLFTA